MSWADAQPAITTGAVDGQENPLAVFNAAKLHTVGQKNLTLWGYVADPLIFVVNKTVWNSWSGGRPQGGVEAAQQAAKEEIARPRRHLGRRRCAAEGDRGQRRGRGAPDGCRARRLPSRYRRGPYKGGPRRSAAIW